MYIGDNLNTGNFYFIKDEYYKRFPNCGLMGNKDNDEAGVHGRPCFYCFEMDGYFWMVPISSKTEKYKAIYDKKKMRLSAEINGIVRKVVRLNKRGVRIVLTDINYILNELNKTK